MNYGLCLRTGEIKNIAKISTQQIYKQKPKK